MADDAALRMRCGARLDFAHLDPGRARRDDHVGRQQLVELPIELLLEVQPLGPVLLDEVGARQRFGKVGSERQVRLRCAGREAQSLERRPGRLHELPQRGFRVRRDVGRDDLQSLGEKQRGPARADHAGADDGDAANGLVVGHVCSPMHVLDFGVGDAGEIALGCEKRPLVRSIELRDVERAGEIGHEHAVARNIERDADAFHQVRDHDLRHACAGFASIGARFTVLPRGGSPRSVQ